MTTDKINYNEKKKQAMLAVIHQLDLKDNNHGIKDVVVVLAEFWNNAVKLAEFNARSDERAKLKEQIKLLEAKLHENKIHRQHTEQVKHYTAKQIFKELDKILVFYPLNKIMINEMIVEYQALKKKYKVD